MQGRQGNDGDRLLNQRYASVNGTGKHRSLPQRPPGITRIDRPPTTPRVARPQRENQPPQKGRRRLLILGVVFVVCGLLACGIGYTIYNLFSAGQAAAGAAVSASDFLGALHKQDYTQAYNDLDVTITIQITPEEFAQLAKNDDRCYGVVTGYTEVAGSAKTQGNSQSYSYSITRSKLSKPYTLQLTLQQGSDGNWKITSYGNDLGPQPPTCK
jgi:hypothetical protein